MGYKRRAGGVKNKECLPEKMERYPLEISAAWGSQHFWWGETFSSMDLKENFTGEGGAREGGHFPPERAGIPVRIDESTFMAGRAGRAAGNECVK